MKQTNKQRAEAKKPELKSNLIDVYGNVATMNDGSINWLTKTTFKVVVGLVVLMTFLMFII